MKLVGEVMSEVLILGIDPGLLNTGWGVVRVNGSHQSFVACGTIKPKASLPMAERLSVIYKDLSDVIEAHGVHECAIEDVFVNKNPDTSLRLGQARGVAMVVGCLMGLSVWEYQNRMIKKSMTGTGSADKGQMQLMVQRLLPKSVIDSEHSTDALAIALTHASMRTYNNLKTVG